MTGDAEPRIDITTDLAPEDCTVVSVSGEVDLVTAPELERRLTEANGRGLPVIVDLGAVEFMDSSGFRTLHRAADVATVILVVPPAGPLRRVVALAGLAELVTICDDMAQASEQARASGK